MKTIFPREFLEHTAEVHYFRFGKKGMIIYNAILCALILAIASLPFIKLDVYTSSPGVIKPISDRYPVVVIVNGLIAESRMSDNQYVCRGDTLLVVNSEAVDVVLNEKLVQKEAVEAGIHDLINLLAGNHRKNNLITGEYRDDLGYFLLEVRGFKLTLDKTRNNFKRDSGLYERNVIARADLEKARFDLQMARKDYGEVLKRKSYEWQSALVEKQKLLGDLNTNIRELKSRKDQFIIRAPANGNLINLRAQNSGSFISPGTTLAEIAPDTRLYAECYINTKDIGLMHEGLPATFQVHAYNSYQWGYLEGEIIGIGSDIILINDTPYYKIRCQLDQDHLNLRNGVTGQLRNGMTITAHFKLAERTAWDLLYDKTEDWIQPRKQLAVHQY